MKRKGKHNPEDEKPEDNNNGNNSSDNAGGDDDKKDSGKKSKFRKIRDKAKKSTRRKVKVYLPAVIKNNEKKDYTQMPDEEPELMTEHYISYKDALLIVEIEKLAAKGLKDKDIIKEVGISPAVFYQRIREEPYFAYALFRHRGVARLNVENALYNNAVGFRYKEQQATPMGLVVEVEKFALPQTKAQEVFLYNRDREQWKRKVETPLEKGQSISNMGVIIKRRA